MRRVVASMFLAAFVAMSLAAAPTTVPPDVGPDGEMHGVRFGATEAQVRARLGPSTGSLQISDSRNALFYGKSHAFVFRKGRLVELHITARPGHRFQYETDGAAVELSFSSRADVKEGEDKYHLMSVRIKSLNTAW